MRYPWANTILLVLVTLMLMTGFGGLISGSERLGVVLWLHSVTSYGVLAVLGWKAVIIVASFRRRRQLDTSRIMFVVLTVLLVATLATGYWWSNLGATYVGGRSVLVWHGYLAVAIAGLLAWHVVARRWILRVDAARDRRMFLRLAGLSAVGLVLERLIEPAKAIAALPGAQRRFTGSYETGSFSGNFPPTIWFLDDPQPVDVQQWRLHISGAVDRTLTLSYEQFIDRAGTPQTALIDCTGGWYSTQEWHGVRLADLLDQIGVQPHARSIIVRSVTGYQRAFPISAARDFLLATHVAGRPLDHGHGFPLRLVAPGHRGFEWIKWITHIEASERHYLVQPPIPLQ